MDLHLPWRRSNRATNPTTEAAAAAAPRPARDWESVAPMGPAALDRSSALLDPKRFRRDLATTWSTPPALERLGHLVTPEAPAGLLQRLAVPVPAYDAPALRFAPARDDGPPAPAPSKSWWPTALSRRAQPDVLPDVSAGQHRDGSRLSEPARTPAVSGPDSRRGFAARGRESQPEQKDAPEPIPATGAGLPDLVAAQPAEAATVVAHPSAARAPAGSTAEPAAAVRATLGAPTESRAAVQPLPRPLLRPPADSSSAGPATFPGHWIGDGPASGPSPIQSSIFARDAPDEPPPVARQTVPDADSGAAAVAGAPPGADAARPATFRRDTPGESQRKVTARAGDLGASTRPAPSAALLGDLVGTRELPRALAPRHDVIGAPPVDGTAVRPSAPATPLAAPWRLTERPTQQSASGPTGSGADRRPDVAASWADSLPATAGPKDLAPPAGLLEQLGRTASVPDPMARGVELLSGVGPAKDPMARGVELLHDVPDGSQPDAGNHGAGNHDAGNHDAGNHDAGNHDAGNHDAGNHGTGAGAGRALPDLAGLGAPLRQVRRAATRPAQRRVTNGVVWPEGGSATTPMARRPASVPDAVASLGAMAHAGGQDARPGAPYPSSDHPSTDAPDAPAAPAPPAAPPTATATSAEAATPQDVADVVRRALLLDRERSGSLADHW